MKKILAAALAALALFCFTACGAKADMDAMLREVGIDASGAEVFKMYDTHSGNGDGVSFFALRFKDGSAEKQIASGGEWDPLPMDKTAEVLAYGFDGENVAVMPYLTDSDGAPLLPAVKNGYYRLIDKQKGESGDMLSRASLNFILSVYDSDSEVMYLCRLDT